MRFNIALFILTLLIANAGAKALPGPCQCEGALKDYDPKKGFYLGRVSGVPPKVSGRFSCAYMCQDKSGKFWSVSYIHEESHFGTKSNGPSHAKWFICDKTIKKFIPRYYENTLMYYDTVAVGAFDPNYSVRPELKEWAISQSCN